MTFSKHAFHFFIDYYWHIFNPPAPVVALLPRTRFFPRSEMLLFFQGSLVYVGLGICVLFLRHQEEKYINISRTCEYSCDGIIRVIPHTVLEIG